MSRPTVLVVGPTPPPIHGNAAYTEMLLGSEELGRAFDLVHLDTSDRRDLENLGRLDPENVRLGLVHALRFAGLVLRRRPDVVYLPVSQNPWAYLRDAVFMVLGWMGGARVVTHLHGGDFRRFYREARGPLRWLIRATTRRLAAAWVLGKELGPLYAGLLEPARVEVVPNGVPDPWGGEGPPEPPEGSFTILYLGGLDRSKGVFDLLEGFHLLQSRVADARLVLAGGWMLPEQEGEARARIRELGMEGAVELPGVVPADEKWEVLARSHVLAYPTLAHEGQPLAILEAMATARPVVATPVGAIPDAVRDGRTGRIVPEGDPAELARALEELARSPKTARELGRGGRRAYLEAFTEEACIRRFRRAMARVLVTEPLS